MGLIDSTSELSQTIIPKQWNNIYLSFAFTQGGLGMGRGYINGEMSNDALEIPNSPPASAFSTSDDIKIGGVFTGELRRLQIYSPGTFGIITENS